MRTIRCCLVWCVLACLLAACTPLYRGFEGAALVSPQRPDVTITVPSLPLMAHGQIAPFVRTDQGYQFPETLVSVYGTAAAAPFAVVALSLVPNNAWEWDPLTFSGPLGQETPGALFGNEGFYGTIRIVSGEKDAFAPLFADKERQASLRWLAQRYAARDDFDRAKIILEYREPLPASLEGAVEVPLYDPEVRAFSERAARAFVVQFGGASAPAAPAPYIKALDARYLGAFLGSMSLKSPLFPVDD